MRNPSGPSRRRFLAGAAGLVGGGIVSATARDLMLAPASAVAPQPTIKPRSAWAEGQRPKGPLPAERLEDVRFLLVHHTAGANGYAQGEVRQTLRGIFDYHTSAAKGWNDVAYNFFVDAFGTIWEAREGSLTTPVKGDATGGSQGFAQLCCFIGDHTKTPPTAAAQTAMADLLAWLAGRYAIDLRAGATTTFVSRGSNLHPAGKTVTTPTLAAHRDMSKTSCPGDACYRLVKGQLGQAAAAKAGAPAASVGVPPTVPADPASSVVVGDPGAPVTSLPPASPTQIEEDNPPPVATPVPPRQQPGATASGADQGASAGRIVGLGGFGTAVAVVGAVVLRRRRSRAAAESKWYSSELLNPPGDGPPPSPLGADPPPAASGHEAAHLRPQGHRPDE